MSVPQLTRTFRALRKHSYTTLSHTTSHPQYNKMDPQEKEQIAQEKYGKPFAELTTNEQKGVGGVHGGHVGGTINKTPEERAAGVVHHEPQAENQQPSAAQESGEEKQ